MNVKIRRALDYLKARITEPSTWRGIVLVSTALGANLSHEQTEAIVTIGLAVAGLIGVVFPDKKHAVTK